MSRADDLARLREEMEAGQRDRVEFVTGVASMVAGVRKANQAENKARRHDILRTLSASENDRRQAAGRAQSARMEFENDRRQAAGRAQSARMEFVTGMASMVAGVRKANQAANASAQAAWHGKTMAAVSAKRGRNWLSRAE